MRDLQHRVDRAFLVIDVPLQAQRGRERNLRQPQRQPDGLRVGVRILALLVLRVGMVRPAVAQLRFERRAV